MAVRYAAMPAASPPARSVPAVTRLPATSRLPATAPARATAPLPPAARAAVADWGPASSAAICRRRSPHRYPGRAGSVPPCHYRRRPSGLLLTAQHRPCDDVSSATAVIAPLASARQRTDLGRAGVRL